MDCEAPATTSIFGIQQGGLYDDLRRECAEALTELDFPGYAVGGLSVGEARDETMRTAHQSVAMLPEHKPRYMMGMGTPVDLVELSGWGLRFVRLRHTNAQCAQRHAVYA